MYEAVALADVIAGTLNALGVRDMGADFRITVSDTAGNVAEVEHEASAGKWVREQGFDRDVFLIRTMEGDSCIVCGNHAWSSVVRALDRLQKLHQEETSPTSESREV